MLWVVFFGPFYRIVYLIQLEGFEHVYRAHIPVHNRTVVFAKACVKDYIFVFQNYRTPSKCLLQRSA